MILNTKKELGISSHGQEDTYLKLGTKTGKLSNLDF